MASTPLPDRIERLSLLAQALVANPDWTELTRLMVLRIFDSWGCTASALFLPTTSGALALEASFGYPDAAISALRIIGKDTEGPLHPAMRADEIAWHPDPVDVEEACRQMPLALDDTQAMLIIPVTRLGIPEHVMVLCFNESLPSNPASLPFVDAVRSLLELHGVSDLHAAKVASNGNLGDAPSSADELELTSRQLHILQLLSLNKTNRWIASDLGFSESTIRQETLRLYRALGVNSRSDAVLVARSIGVLPEV